MMLNGLFSQKMAGAVTRCLSGLFLIISLFSVPEASYLSARGAKLYNDKGEAVRLTGVNWFGFETSNMGPHGLWARDYHGILLQIKSLGFNCVRIPFCNTMLRDGAKIQSINFYGEDPFYKREITQLNKELDGLAPLQIMDEIIRYAGECGLAVILDNHSREPDGYMNEKLWYTAITSEQQWIDDWVMLAERYKGNRAVIGFDLNNEPHGKAKDGGATWGAGNPATDWNTAAQKCGNAILAVNPDVLIIIEGVEQANSNVYWWGGNLQGVKTHPIALSKPEKLVYSPHEYGPEVFQQPWFDNASFPDNMEAIWDESFGFIVKQNIAPLLVGEFGINDMKSYNNKAGIWFKTFLKYMADNYYSWTFWTFNPNSGDTGGMLKYDWVTVEEWKLDAVKGTFAPPVVEPAATRKPVRRFTASSNYLVFTNNTISLSGFVPEKTRIDIVNVRGQVVHRTEASSLHMGDLPAGMYTAVLYRNNSVVQSMVISNF
jgi:aryl-phospho-beta-D-glucosidase BglC (GH1 family)